MNIEIFHGKDNKYDEVTFAAHEKEKKLYVIPHKFTFRNREWIIVCSIHQIKKRWQ